MGVAPTWRITSWLDGPPVAKHLRAAGDGELHREEPDPAAPRRGRAPGCPAAGAVDEPLHDVMKPSGRAAACSMDSALGLWAIESRVDCGELGQRSRHTADPTEVMPNTSSPTAIAVDLWTHGRHGPGHVDAENGRCRHLGAWARPRHGGSRCRAGSPRCHDPYQDLTRTEGVGSEDLADAQRGVVGVPGRLRACCSPRTQLSSWPHQGRGVSAWRPTSRCRLGAERPTMGRTGPARTCAGADDADSDGIHRANRVRTSRPRTPPFRGRGAAEEASAAGKVCARNAR